MPDETSSLRDVVENMSIETYQPADDASVNPSTRGPVGNRRYYDVMVQSLGSWAVLTTSDDHLLIHTPQGTFSVDEHTGSLSDLNFDTSKISIECWPQLSQQVSALSEQADANTAIGPKLRLAAKTIKILSDYSLYRLELKQILARPLDPGERWTPEHSAISDNIADAIKLQGIEKRISAKGDDWLRHLCVQLYYASSRQI